jgi:hypothetical protein
MNIANPRHKYRIDINGRCLDLDTVKTMYWDNGLWFTLWTGETIFAGSNIISQKAFEWLRKVQA